MPGAAWLGAKFWPVEPDQLPALAALLQDDASQKPSSPASEVQGLHFWVAVSSPQEHAPPPPPKGPCTALVCRCTGWRAFQEQEAMGLWCD